jgi:hypothetical protein
VIAKVEKWVARTSLSVCLHDSHAPQMGIQLAARRFLNGLTASVGNSVAPLPGEHCDNIDCPDDLHGDTNIAVLLSCRVKASIYFFEL